MVKRTGPLTSAAILEAFVLGLGLALGGASLLFLSRQCRAATDALGRDFKAVLFVGDDLDPKEAKEIESRIASLKGVHETLYVTRDEALARLSREDPDFVRSVALVGPNPLPAALEVKLDPEAFGLNPAVLAEMAAAAEGKKVSLRYPRKELEALFQTKFYARVIGLVIATLSCLALILVLPAAIGFFHSVIVPHPGTVAWKAWARVVAEGILPIFSSSAFGAMLGLGLAWLVFWPGAIFLPGTPSPSGGSQAALVATCGALGWALLRRSGESHGMPRKATEGNG